MKLHGVKISGPNVETIIIPRGDGAPIVLKAQAVLDMDEFNRLCPMPEAPMKMIKGGARVPNTEDPHFLAAAEDVGKKRIAFMLVKSLEVTPGLEWDTVKLNEPSTWLNYNEELKESGFSDVEVNRIIAGVMAANCLSDDKIDEARQRFLASEEALAATSLSQTAELSSGQSGLPASASA